MYNEMKIGLLQNFRLPILQNLCLKWNFGIICLRGSVISLEKLALESEETYNKCQKLSEHTISQLLQILTLNL